MFNPPGGLPPLAMERLSQSSKRVGPMRSRNHLQATGENQC